jgi:hypothetical protein
MVLKNTHFDSNGNSVLSKICTKIWVSKTKVEKNI